MKTYEQWFIDWKNLCYEALIKTMYEYRDEFVSTNWRSILDRK